MSNLRSTVAQRTYVSLKPWLSASLKQRIAAWARAWRHWRVQPFATRWLGLQYRRSRRRIELNITYACNLSCHNCDRSSPQAPTDLQLSVQQIQQFISESIAARACWAEIVLIGGEPTVHHDFLKIVELIREYRDQYSPSTRIEVFTNGFGSRAQRLLSQVPNDVHIVNSAKARNPYVDYHDAFNIAPKDIARYANADFRNGCQITEVCGIGLGPSGYYPCGAASSMDRVMGWGVGRQSLPAHDDEMTDLLERFCSACGHFNRDRETPPRSQLNSPTWADAYSNYQHNPPTLPIYGQSIGLPGATPGTAQ